MDPASGPGQTVNRSVWHPRTRTVRTDCSFPRECSSCRQYPKPKGRHINQGIKLTPRPSGMPLSFDFHAATNIRYNSVKRNSHKALLPYGNKLKRLGRYISQDLKGYISLYTATPHGLINRGHTSLGLPPQMATAAWKRHTSLGLLPQMAIAEKGTPALGCHPIGQHWNGYTSLGLPP